MKTIYENYNDLKEAVEKLDGKIERDGEVAYINIGQDFGRIYTRSLRGWTLR